ncbi:MAG: Ig-like domain-containing protein [Anaerolineales bacterium]|nr:Ig-like domain-containing protein [Anaerolineales bacterium]
MNKIHFLVLILLILALLTSSCAQQAETSPRIWIDSPADGALVPSGGTITVLSHAYAKQGIAEVVLSVNGEAYRRDVPESQGAEYTQVSQDWQPNADGTYAIQVQAYDTAGQTSNIASITVRVEGAATVDTPTPVPTEETITPTPVITETPTQVPGSTIQFWAEPVQVQAGACTTVRWHVENASRVIFGGVDQPLNGSYQTCLCKNERYTLTVIQLDGTEVKQSLDITVNGVCETPALPPPAQDTTPPPVPSPAVPADGLTLACRSTQNLVWIPVNDPSGISGYYVKLEMQTSPGNWQSAGGFGPVSDKQVTVNVQCGVYYRWMVRAQDGAGNFSGWSAPSSFSINLN